MATNIKAVVRQSGAVLTNQPTLTLKNTIKDEINLREISNVIEGTPSDGDVLTFNSDLNKYEVRPITGLDGGTF